MSFRKILFWSHLVAGLAAGLAIAVMCFTGTTLAFEKQLVAWAERDVRLVPAPAPGAARQSLEQMMDAVRDARPDSRPSAITFSADPRVAVAFAFGRDATLYADPHTGAVRTPTSTRMHDFLHTMEDWHRWLALSGDARPIGKLINGVANAAFLVLALTGLYLWLPRTWSWRGVRAVAVLNLRLSGKARDFNWHNAVGLWCAPVLIVLTLTALPMSFRWANNLVYTLAGDTAPTRAGPGAFGGSSVEVPAPPAGAHPLSRDALFDRIRADHPRWTEITLRLSSPGGERGSRESQRARSGASGPQAATFIVREAGAWPRIASTTVSLDPFTGATLQAETFADLPAGRRARTWTRFLHTGEALGWPGQLIAGLATLGGCVLVYTGFALAWRRFFGSRKPAG